MLNPHFVAGEHGLFGGHKSEDIRTFYFVFSNQEITRLIKAIHFNMHYFEKGHFFIQESKNFFFVFHGG